MDLSLPRFASFEDGALSKTRLWPITERPPSSPASVRDGNRSRTPSPCYQLDTISSASSAGETTPSDYRLTLATDSAHSVTPVGSVMLSSDDDVPLCFIQEDRRKVQRRDVLDDGLPGPNEVREYVPAQRNKPVNAPIYTPTPRDRPVDGWEYEPLYKVRPAGYKVKTAMPEERTEYTQDPMGKPMSTRMQKPRSEETPDNDETCEPIPRKGPVKPKKYDVTPRIAAEDNQSNKNRPTDEETAIPTLDGRPDNGLKTPLSPQGVEDETEAFLLKREAPPPSEVPDWSEGEAMPLIIIENSSEMPTKGY